MTRDPISEAHRQWVAHGWPGAADGMAMVTSVVRAHQLLMERIDAVLRADLRQPCPPVRHL